MHASAHPQSILNPSTEYLSSRAPGMSSAASHASNDARVSTDLDQEKWRGGVDPQRRQQKKQIDGDANAQAACRKGRSANCHRLFLDRHLR